MPELPEVEIVRRGLEPALAGRAFARVEQNRPDLRFPLPTNLPGELQGRKVERLERRGKYLLAHLSGGHVLLMHLGMTGLLHCRCAGVAGTRQRVPAMVNESGGGKHSVHDHVVFHMQGGATVTYNDPRRFGFMLLIPIQ